MAETETYAKDPYFWQNSDGTPKSREAQIEILNQVSSDFSKLSLKSKNEVLDTYATKVKPMPVISTGKVRPGGDEVPDWTSEIPQIAGGIVGGLVDKTVPGRIIKAGVLGGGGEAVKQIYQHATGSPLAPKTSMEAGGKIAEAMVAQGGGQAIGEGLTRFGAKLLPKIKPEYLESGIVEPGAELKKFMLPHEEGAGIFRRTLGLPAKEKATFTIGQQADPMSAVVKLETIVESSMFGGQPIKRLKWTQEKAIQNYAKSVSDSVWDGLKNIPPSEQGKVLTDAVRANITNFHQAGKVLYENIDELIALENPIKGKILGYVDLKPLTITVKDFAKSMESRAGLGASEAGDTFVKKALNLKNKMTFGEAQELRSSLLSEQRKLDKGEKANFVIKQLLDSLDTQMETAAKNISPDVFTAWRGADAFWKAGKERYENDFIRGLVETAVKNKQPELIGKQIFQNTEVGQVNLVKDALGFDTKTGLWKTKQGKDAFQAIKAGWFEELLGKATKITAGELEEATRGNVLYESLRGMAGRGKNWWEGESIKSMFNPQEIELIRNFEVATRVAQRKPSGTSGSMLIQLVQSKPLVDVATLLAGGGLIGGGAYLDNPEAIAGGIAVLAMPKVLGSMLVKPKWQKLFIEGLNVNKPLAWPILSKLITGAVETKLEMDRHDALMAEQPQSKYTQNRQKILQ